MEQELDTLVELSRNALPRMWDDSTGLFSHKSIPAGDGFVNEGSNLLYSAISLIAILEDGDQGSNGEADIVARTLDALHAAVQKRDTGAAVTACVIWASALAGDSRGAEIVRAVSQKPDTSGLSSMDLGLLLAAFAKASELVSRNSGVRSSYLALLERELRGRFVDRASLFRATDRLQAVRSLSQARLTSFASQVYPIHGLAQLARISSSTLAPEAIRAAERIVKLQGPLGQWWWQYSIGTGRIVGGYPVYSVHQDAMAYLALAPIGPLGGADYSHALRRGLQWVAGENELERSLVDATSSLIFRAIQRTGTDPDGRSGLSRRDRRLSAIRSYGIRIGDPMVAVSDLEILRECRSYHLAWVLYAKTLSAAL